LVEKFVSEGARAVVAVDINAVNAQQTHDRRCFQRRRHQARY
jgi:hypothetical protein